MPMISYWEVHLLLVLSLACCTVVYAAGRTWSHVEASSSQPPVAFPVMPAIPWCTRLVPFVADLFCAFYVDFT